MVLPDEDPRELAELQEGLIAELRPKGILQREIVARIAANIWRLRRIGYVTADYADDLRHLRRTAELDHYMELRKMEKTATPQELADFDDGQGMSPWLSGVQMVAAEIEQPPEKRPILSLMAAEERIERSMMAAVRLLGRVQKAQGAAEEDETSPDERNEANVGTDVGSALADGILVDDVTSEKLEDACGGKCAIPSAKADPTEEDAGAAVEGCAGGTPAPQVLRESEASDARMSGTKPNGPLDTCGEAVMASHGIGQPRYDDLYDESDIESAERRSDGTRTDIADGGDPGGSGLDPGGGG
jgi:hypothetical protein